MDAFHAFSSKTSCSSSVFISARLTSTYGETKWVRNLRAAGEATLTRGHRSERISVIEVGAKEAAPVLQHFVSTVPVVVRPYFDVTPASPLITFEQEVARHPVFRVMPTAPNL